jgi:hypothetical protein
VRLCSWSSTRQDSKIEVSEKWKSFPSFRLSKCRPGEFFWQLHWDACWGAVQKPEKDLVAELLKPISILELGMVGQFWLFWLQR